MIASILDLPDGLHLDVPASVYHERIPGVASKSALDLVERAPSFYAAWLAGRDRKETPSLFFGAALHCALLEPIVFAKDYAVEPDFGDCRFKEAKATRDAWRKEHTGRKLLEPDDATAIQGICAAVRAHPLVGRMLEGGVAEATVRWVDPETGIICKARSDQYIEALSAVVDIKTTDDARAHAFRQSCARYRYHVQQAHYSDGFAAIGKPLERFVFVAVEKAAPYEVAAYMLDADAVSRGREATRRNLTTLADCIEAGAYPGYETSIQTLDLPAWA